MSNQSPSPPNSPSLRTSFQPEGDYDATASIYHSILCLCLTYMTLRSQYYDADERLSMANPDEESSKGDQDLKDNYEGGRSEDEPSIGDASFVDPLRRGSDESSPETSDDEGTTTQEMYNPRASTHQVQVRVPKSSLPSCSDDCFVGYLGIRQIGHVNHPSN